MKNKRKKKKMINIKNILTEQEVAHKCNSKQIMITKINNKKMRNNKNFMMKTEMKFLKKQQKNILDNSNRCNNYKMGNMVRKWEKEITEMKEMKVMRDIRKEMIITTMIMIMIIEVKHYSFIILQI